MDLKNKIKLVGVDLDGTLLNDDKRLCTGAEKTLECLYEKGIQLVPITGRPYSGIPDFIKNLKAVSYIISSNGAVITDVKNEKALFSFAMDNSKARSIITILNKAGCMFEAFCDNVGYIEEPLYTQHKKQFENTPIWDYIKSSRVVTDSIEALYTTTDKTADEIFINCNDREQRIMVLEMLSGIEDIQYCVLGDRFFEITKKGTDKGVALGVLCEYLGIDIRNTIAFGDGENDIQFLEKAGVAVAMENATTTIKEMADIITKTNNENGVCEILKTL